MSASIKEKDNQFQMVVEHGWKRGLNNLLRGEFSRWFKSSRWWKHILIWVGIVSLDMLFMAIASRDSAAKGGEGPEVFFMYGIFGGMFVAFGVMIIMQRAIVGEKRYGTAAWVLSKPVTRSAFVVSRLIGNIVCILLTAVLIPGIISYFIIGALSPVGWPSPLGFFAGIMVIGVHTFFWSTLTLMMGTLFESAAGVIAVPMAVFFGLWFLGGMMSWLPIVSPLMLAFGPSPEMPGIAIALMGGTPVSSWVPMATTAVLSAIFITVAISRFGRQEL